MTPIQEQIERVKDLEEWRHTNLEPLSRLPFQAVPSPLSVSVSCSNETPKPFTDLAAHPFAALNSTLSDKGSVIRIGRGKIVETPIEVIHRAAMQDAAFYPRLSVILEEEARAILIERFTGSGRYFTDAVTEIRLEAGARLVHLRLQEESPEAFHIGNVQVVTARDALYDSFVFSSGGRLARSDLGVSLQGEGSGCSLNGLYLVAESRHTDHHTSIDHRSPYATSSEIYNGILQDHASAVFDGKIVVRPNASGTSARQTNRNLLLSDEAVVNTRPLLEILNNDVKCNHGATIGRLDENQIFYLKSRGLSDAEARGLLTYAFAADLLEKMPPLPVRSDLQQLLFRKFAGNLPPMEGAR